MSLTLLIMTLALATSCATLLGGVAALRFRDALYLILAFSAGTVIALAFFDLLPESLRLGRSPATLLAVAALGFFGYAVLDRLLLAHGDTAATGRGWAGAGSLSAHSLMDGLALGMGFKASTAVGVVVAVAILAHDCSDGMNTVSVVLKNNGARRHALIWLGIDAAAPLLGAATSLFVKPSADGLALVLAAFAGFFLYIGASDLLPESFQARQKLQTMIATLAGAGLLYIVTRVAG